MSTLGDPLDDPRVFQAIAEYQAELEAGRRPERAAFLARHSALGGRLAGCLDALEFVKVAVPNVRTATEDNEDLTPGTLLGGFRIVRPLGHGGMGVVYFAEDVKLTRPVALKVMKPGLAADAMARKRFVREAKAVALLQHDHIVTTFQVGEDDGVLFLAMELLKGESLDERLKSGLPLPLSQTLRIIRETAEGLAAAHDRGLIHRDIKPANIFLVSGDRAPSNASAPVSDLTPPDSPFTVHSSTSQSLGRVKILDFGLARPTDGNGRLTQTGIAVGTPQYMAPEQAAGDVVDHRADLFSLGCVLFRILTGSVPFLGGNQRETFKAVMFDPPQAQQALFAAYSTLSPIKPLTNCGATAIFEGRLWRRPCSGCKTRPHR